jgi:hypothetical protein
MEHLIDSLPSLNKITLSDLLWADVEDKIRSERLHCCQTQLK